MTIRQADLSDCFELAPRLRPVDQMEVLAAGHATVLTALTESLVTSKEAWVFVDEAGVVQAMGGVAETDGYGVPWLLGTDEVYKYQKQLFKTPYQHVKRWATEYKGLMNLTHKSNTVSQRWLKRMGFQLRPAPIPGYADWILFTMRNPNV